MAAPAGQSGLVDRMLGNAPTSEEPLTLTASYVLPEDDIDMLSKLAALRLERDKLERRAARRAGVKPPTQARRSASAIVRAALDAHRPQIMEEIADLEKELGK